MLPLLHLHVCVIKDCAPSVYHTSHAPSVQSLYSLITKQAFFFTSFWRIDKQILDTWILNCFLLVNVRTPLQAAKVQY